MKNIIKAQLFQLKHERFCFVLMIIISIFLVFVAWADNSMGIQHGLDPVSGGMTFFNFSATSIFITMLPVLMLVGQICCSDFNDKTTNYELMSGHRRIEVYIGRVIPCIIVCTISAMLVIAVPIIFMTIIYGWGDEVKTADFILRFLLLAIVIMRIICEYIFFSFLVKNQYIVMGLAYVFFSLELSGIFSANTTPILGITNINMIFAMDTWVTYGLDSSVNIVYNSAMPPLQIISTLLVSVIVSAAVLALGFVFFKNDDLN